MGRNGSGKSGIMDAIAYAFTGSCRGTDEAGRGYETLAAPGTKGVPVIILETDQGLINRTVGTGPKSQTQEKILGMLRCDRPALRCAVNSQAFLDLDPKDQEAIMRTLAASQVTVADAKKALGVDVDGISAASLVTMDGVVQAYQIAFGARAALKKQLESAQNERMAEPPPVEWDGQQANGSGPEQINAMLASVKQVLAGMDAAKAQGDKMQWLRGERSQIEKHLEDLRSKIAPLPPKPELLTKVAQLKGQVEKFREERAERSKQGQVWSQKAQAALARVEALQTRLRKLESLGAKGGQCDACGQDIDSYKSRQMREEIMAGMKEAAKVAHSSQEAAERMQGTLLNDGGQAELEQAETTISQIASIREDAKKSKERIAEIDKLLTEAPAFSPERYVELVKVQSGLQSHLDCHSRRQALLDRVSGLQRNVDDMDAAVKALGPGGLVRQLHMGGGLEEIAGAVSAMAAIMGLGQVQIVSAPKFAVVVNGRPATMLSSSERFRVSMAFAVAVAKKTGVNMVCLDGADILDEYNRDLLLDLVEDPRIGLDQVLIAATSTTESFQAGGWTPVYLAIDSGRTIVKQG